MVVRKTFMGGGKINHVTIPMGQYSADSDAGNRSRKPPRYLTDAAWMLTLGRSNTGRLKISKVLKGVITA